MARQKELTVQKVLALDERGWHPDGGGLYLQVSAYGTKSWVFRYTFQGRPRWMGLGSVDDVRLSDARALRDDARLLLAKKIDPLAERGQQREEARQKAASRITFGRAADKYLAAHESAWKNAKHRQQWHTTLRQYVLPTLGQLPVNEITMSDVLRVVDPIWRSKPETASRVRGRIETVLDWAKAHGYRTGENPARWAGNLKHALPAKAKVHKVKHHNALHYNELPGFLAELRQRDGVAPMALEFTVLTGSRTNEVIGANWSEIDTKARVWNVPGDRMKSGKDHTVPLTPRAFDIICEAMRQTGGPFLFTNVRSGKSLSHAAMAKVLRGMRPDATVHGMRSAFSTWVAEQTAFPVDVREAALAHTNKDRVAAAYQRGPMLDKRRKLMESWERFATTPTSGDLVPLRKERA